jgi:Pregnancy-associated plasma protein-A
LHRSSARRHSLFATAAVVAAVAAGLFVSPASASGQGSAAGCDLLTAGGAQLFDPLSSFTPLLARGGDGPREPGLGQTSSDLPARAKGKAKAGFEATVPVYFHIVTDGSIGAISDKAVRDQMMALNLSFGGFYGGADTGFSFDLAGVDRTDNAAWFYAGPSTKEERDMKTALHRGGANALNLYSTTAGVYLGWAYLPSIVKSPGHAYIDGIVVDWESMPGTSTKYEDRYDLGFTATHEAGHWLNLEHTFYGGCNHWGDYVEDTPAQLTATSGCPADGTQDSCPKEPGYDPIHNYMDYSYDQCYYEFTPGQAQREQDSWLYYRAAV